MGENEDAMNIQYWTDDEKYLGNAELQRNIVIVMTMIVITIRVGYNIIEWRSVLNEQNWAKKRFLMKWSWT